MKSSLLTFLKGSIRAVRAFFHEDVKDPPYPINHSNPLQNPPQRDPRKKKENREKREEVVVPEIVISEPDLPISSADSVVPLRSGTGRDLFRTKDDIRKAILLSEILHRPEERWQVEKKEDTP